LLRALSTITIPRMDDTPAGLDQLGPLSDQIHSDLQQVSDLDSQIQGLSGSSQADMQQLESLTNQQQEMMGSLVSAVQQRADTIAKIASNLP
jgi:methyl-accepting chemotaxis protein